MLSKKERLGRRDFAHLFKTGQRRHNTFFTLVYTASPTFHGAVAIPKKVARTAVQRNKIRRRVYDILRRMDTVRACGGVYIVLVKRPAVTASYAGLRTSLAALLTEAWHHR